MALRINPEEEDKVQIGDTTTIETRIDRIEGMEEADMVNTPILLEGMISINLEAHPILNSVSTLISLLLLHDMRSKKESKSYSSRSLPSSYLLIYFEVSIESC